MIMKLLSLHSLVLAGCVLGFTIAVSAADVSPAPTAPPAQRPDLNQIQQRREEWQKMTPEQRDARMREMRTNNSRTMTPQEMEARRKVMRDRLEQQIEDLKKKKSEGTITTNETARLNSLEQWLKRWDQAALQRTNAAARTNATARLSLPATNSPAAK